MDARLFRRIQRYGWDAATDAYDRDWVPLLENLTRDCVARARLEAGDRVLDVATGTGVGAHCAARAVGPTGAVTGIDISEQMIARALERAGAPDAHAAPIRFERRDMEDSAAPDGAFDAVVAAFGLMYAADRTAAFAELARVLAPGGRASVCVWGRRAACGWAEVFPIVDAHVESEVCPLFFSLGAPRALALAFERAGLRDVVEERVSLVLRWASADEACSAMLEGGAVALAWKRFSPAVRTDVRAAYLASIEAYRRGAGYEVPSEIVFATARKP
jgi:ubiquinone/menaquinone biosynthesis C-methylase UbiE